MKNILHLFFLVSLLLLNTINGFGQTTIFDFTFENTEAVTTDNAVGMPTFTAFGVLNQSYLGGYLSTNCATTGGFSTSYDNWSANDYCRFSVDATGYNTMTFSACLRTSNVLIGTFKVRASSNSGGTWTDIQASFTPTTGGVSYGGALPSTFDGQNNVWIEVFKINTAGSTGNILRIDNGKLVGNVNVSNTISAPSTISNQNLANCSATATINVTGATSTGTFSAGNNYTAQLSDASGSFTTPLATASVTSTSNTIPDINLIVPAGTPTGSGYLIRIISTNPSVIGLNSNTFTITQGGTCVSTATDYFRSRQTGNWNSSSTWESSNNNTDWINSSLVPNSSANTITIQNGHTITINSTITTDQIIIQSGGIVNHSGGTLNIVDGAGDDFIVEGGGIFISDATLASFSGSSILRVKSNAILRSVNGNDGARYAASGLNSPNSVTNNVVWENTSIYEYTQNNIFGSAGVTYFPNVTETEIPIFRTTGNVGVVGASTTTNINGIFEINGTITWQNSGIKTFRNGIRGTGTITQNANSGKLVINGTTAELSGITLNLNSTNGLSLENNGTININSNLTLASGLLNFVSSDLNLNGKTFLVNGGTIQEDLASNFTILDNTATTELSQGGNVQYSASVTNTATNFFGLGLWLNHNGSGDYPINVKRRHYAAGYGNAITRIYDITGTPTGVSTIGINYASSELGLIATPLKISRWQSGSGWANYDPTTANYANRFVTYNNVTGFSSWTLSSATISLPVSLVSFEAKQITDNQANITWTTATEINNKQFEIWKSIDGFDYNLINTKDGQGNSNQIKNYTFIDNQFNENSYYQLKQIDNNGQINNVGLKFLPRKSENNIEIYPNPITEKIYIRNQTADLSIIIFDNIGRKIIETTNQNELQTQLDLLPKGIYTAQFRNKNGLKYQILVKN